MTTELNAEILERALTLLAGRLELDQAPPVRMVVCGGSSMIATRLVARTTTDLDILAFFDDDNSLRSAKPLPQHLAEAARQVAEDLGLDSNWLNAGPADLVKFGLPEGFTDRLQPKEYGSHLTVYFISRFDQIHLKTYAATDMGPGRHVDDLLALDPTDDELLSAARWARTQDPSEDFRIVLKDMLEKLGHEKVAEEI